VEIQNLFVAVKFNVFPVVFGVNVS